MKSVIILTTKSSSLKLSRSQAEITSKVQLRFTIIQRHKTSYRQISNTEIPEQIEITLSEYFSGFIPGKVFKGNDGTYKITGSFDSRKGTVVFNRTGEILKVEAEGHKPENTKNNI